MIEIMMSKKRRSDIEISADILKVALHGAKKSHIVYRANLNFEVVKRYLQHLSEAGLINFPSLENRLFKTTQKGKEYIQRYENLNMYMEAK
jgi:predicted transcriptional regulator